VKTAIPIAGLVLLAGFGASSAAGQQANSPMPSTVEGLLSAAKGAAGLEFPGTFLRLCVPPPPAGGGGGGGGGGGAAPSREGWYAEPARIGDNLYFLGTKVHSAYALVASTGEIIVIDALFAYATPDEIVGGLTRVGLDPQNVRYVLISHAHGDHDGGARYLQDTIPGATLVYGEGDWPAVLARTAPHAVRSGPENDGTDGRVISVGDVSVRIVTMPGHTPGTLSFLFEFRDGAQPVRVAYVGGTAISFTNPDPAFYDGYIASSAKVAAAAASYGAVALMSNHTEFDNGYFKAHTAAARTSSDVRNPFIVGAESVQDYFRVVQYCATATKMRATAAVER
jgi:metallo-beta-lactamase class B